MCLIYPSQPEEINKTLKEKSRAFSSLLYLEKSTKSSRKLSSEQASSYFEKVQKDYNQLEEKLLNLSVKWKKLCITTADICLSSSYKTFQAIFDKSFDEVMSDRTQVNQVRFIF